MQQNNRTHKAFFLEVRRLGKYGQKLQSYLIYTLSIQTDRHLDRSGPKVIKLFSCSTQLSMKFVFLINLKLLTIANSFLLNIAEHENFSANKYENASYCWHFHIY